MRRREFIGLVGAVAAWPTRAQQATIPIVGFLGSTMPEHYEKYIVWPIQRGIRDAGFVEGSNVGFEYRWANDQPERLPRLATELVELRVAAIVTTGGNGPVRAAMAATSIVPIVFATGADPVQTGLVTKLSGSGTNVTGVTFYNNVLWPKRLELMRDALPGAKVFGMLMHRETPSLGYRGDIEAAIEAAASEAKVDLFVVVTEGQADLQGAFRDIVRKGAKALLVDNHAHFASRLTEIISLATQHRMPTMTYNSRGVRAGGLISYGPQLDNMDEILRQAGIYVARILKGEKPSDLPIQQPTKFELAINLKTAKALGITLAPSLLARADDVIE